MSHTTLFPFLKPPRVHQIRIRNAPNGILKLLWADGFYFFSRNARVDKPRFEAAVFQYHCAGCDEAVFLHYGMIHDDGTHANQHIVHERTAVYECAMADGNVVADGGGGAQVGAVQDGAVLNVDFVANADAVDIAAHHRLKPDAAIVADDHVANDGRIFR